MILNNNNLSVLPWYGSLAEQQAKKSYAYGEVYPLYAPADFFLPFQLIRKTRTNEIRSFKVVNANTNAVIADYTEHVKDAGLQIVRFENLGYDVILFPAYMPMPLNQFDGRYYFTMSDGVETWYSEVITVVQNVSAYLKVQWWDVENLVFDNGQIVYKNPTFKNTLYLNTELGMPDYEFEEEGEERDGYFFPEKQISEKTYKFSFLAPEYLCDVMRLIRLSDIVQVTDKYGHLYNVDSFLIEPKWQQQGNLASVECEFQTDTVVKKIGRGYITGHADFNGDFNNDFNIIQ